MERVIWSKRTARNLNKIWRFYAKKTISGADSIVKGIKNTGDALVPNVLHQTEENLRADQYRVIYKHFKIVYKVKNNQILILQIFDARQEPNKLKP